ncbi:Uncharacterised protein [Mycobacteroides abscessus subsp. abscessus]|nr:Uncharacterised protein [Mycobacteroides abscessus subsp. abscessus]
MIQFRQRRRRTQTDADAHRAVQCAGDHRRHPDTRGDLQQGVHATKGRHLEHRDIGRPRLRDTKWITCAPDAFVCSDRHSGEPPAQFGQFLHGGAWLFGVLQGAVAGQRGQRVDCLRNSPATVGIDPHPADPSANRLDASDIVIERLSRLGHFDLRGLGARESGQHLGYIGGGHRGHRRVDWYAVTARRGQRAVRGLDGGGQPRGGLGRLILGKRTELTPARRAVDQRDFPGGDAAKSHPHGQRDNMQPVEHIV